MKKNWKLSANVCNLEEILEKFSKMQMRKIKFRRIYRYAKYEDRFRKY